MNKPIYRLSLGCLKEKRARAQPSPPFDHTYAPEGRAIAQAVSRWLPTAAARVQTRVWSSGIYGGQMALGQVFS
jgi:hypothetical protein